VAGASYGYINGELQFFATGNLLSENSK
jgi:hypothetical protein